MYNDKKIKRKLPHSKLNAIYFQLIKRLMVDEQMNSALFDSRNVFTAMLRMHKNKIIINIQILLCIIIILNQIKKKIHEHRLQTRNIIQLNYFS